MTSQSYLITWRGNCSKIESIVSFDGHQGQQNEQLKQFFIILLIWHRKHILYATILINIVNRPIRMFSTSIQPFKWLFM